MTSSAKWQDKPTLHISQSSKSYCDMGLLPCKVNISNILFLMLRCISSSSNVSQSTSQTWHEGWGYIWTINCMIGPSLSNIVLKHHTITQYQITTAHWLHHLSMVCETAPHHPWYSQNWTSQCVFWFSIQIHLITRPSAHNAGKEHFLQAPDAGSRIRHALLFLPRVVQSISVETPALLKRTKTIPSRVALSPACQ